MKLFIILPTSVFSALLLKKKYCNDLKKLTTEEQYNCIDQPKEGSDNICNDTKTAFNSLEHKIVSNNVENSKIDDLPSIITNENERKEHIENRIFSADLRQIQKSNFTTVFDNTPKKENDNDFLCSKMKESYEKIFKFMSTILKPIQFAQYSLKLADVNQIYDFLFVYRKCYLDNNFQFDIYDPKLIKILDFVLLKFNKNTKFSDSNYLQFDSELFGSINTIKELKPFLKKLKAIDKRAKRYLFYVEFLKLVKHLANFPELLTIGRVFTYNSPHNLIISIHFINLLLDRGGSDVKIPILFLIKKIFVCASKASLDFFSLQVLRTNCNFNKFSLHFFTWEMSTYKRKILKQKIRSTNILYFDIYEGKHFKSVLLIFVYQHILFLKFYDVNKEESEKYFQLIDTIIQKNNCPDCDFNSFINLLKCF